MKKKTLALLLSLVMVIGCAVGGTIAWLTAQTKAVVNTFTTSDINITLKEDAGGEGKEFKMVPGYTITKDPKVTVAIGSQKCYLFVKLEKAGDLDSFLTYTMAGGWTALEEGSNVYYRVVDTNGMGTPYSILLYDQVAVKDTVTKAMMNSLTTETYPTLTVTAYASQYMKDNEKSFSAAEAWGNVPKPSGNK